MCFGHVLKKHIHVSCHCPPKSDLGCLLISKIKFKFKFWNIKMKSTSKVSILSKPMMKSRSKRFMKTIPDVNGFQFCVVWSRKS